MKTYSIYSGKTCYASGLTYREAILWCEAHLLSDDEINFGYEIFEDDGIVND